MDTQHVITLERCILATVLDPYNEEQLPSLQPSDFYHLSHQKIFSAMQRLEKLQKPIHEDFLRPRLSQKDVPDKVLMDILIATPASNIDAYIDDLREISAKRELSEVATKIRASERESKDDIEHLKNKLQAIESKNISNVGCWKKAILKKGGFVTMSLIDSYEDMKYLIDNVIIHNQITTLVGEPNVGKSAITMAFIKKMFKDGKITELVYLDPDNPLVYTKERIQSLIEEYGDEAIRYYAGATSTTSEMMEVLETLCVHKQQGSNVLVVVDGYQKMITGGSIGDDTAIRPLIDAMQKVRDVFGATIIGLHHTKKSKSEDGKLQYIGSQAINALSDNLSYISKDEVTKDILVENAKARGFLSPRKSYSLNFNDMTIQELDCEHNPRMEFNEYLRTWDGKEMLLDDAKTKTLTDGWQQAKKDGRVRMYKQGEKWWVAKNDSVVVTEFSMPSVLD